MEKPRVKDLVEAVSISKTYASDILADKQQPSRPLAIEIFRKTGWQHPMLAGMTKQEIAVLARIDPWVPVSERA